MLVPEIIETFLMEYTVVLMLELKLVMVEELDWDLELKCFGGTEAMLINIPNILSMWRLLIV